MGALTEDQNHLQVDDHTYIQGFKIGWSAMDRQIFERQKCFQNSAGMFDVLF
jgi:hypothetical protein